MAGQDQKQSPSEAGNPSNPTASQDAKRPQQSPAEPRRYTSGSAEQIAAVQALMAGKELPAQGGGDQPPPIEGEPAGQDEGELQGQDEGELQGEGQAAAAPANIDELAESFGMTKRELNAIAVKVGDDTLTLGELKARLPELVKVGARAAELDEAREALDLQRSDTYRRITAIVDAFPPGSVPASVVAAIEQRHQETRAREAAMLNASRPEWADPKYSGAQRERMAKQAAKYGFGKGEVAALLDHRMVLLLQDYTNLQERVDKAKADARRVGERQAVTPARDGPAAVNGKPGELNQRGRYRSSQSIAGDVSRIIARR